MYYIKNLIHHYYNNGDAESYSATIYNDKESLDVIFSQGGNNFVAYEPKTNLIYHLSVADNISTLADFKDGDELDIITAIKESRL